MSDSVAAGSKVGELLDAYLGALQEGKAPPREQLLAEHPELAAALDGLDFIHRATRELPAATPSESTGLERQLLGDFRLVREVGRGGMAVVYEAEQVSLGRRVALKVLPFAAVLDSRQLQRFKNEALAAAHLRHPHIVPVYAVGCERGVHYYAMQLVEGQSLALVIREMKGSAPASEPKTPLSSHGSNRAPSYVRNVVALGMQAAEALDHAHELGIVHRDIKPGNLLVDGAGELWITDFGLARSLHDADLTTTGELLGTFRYMSPEQTLAKRALMDHRTDIYSLGVTLYELFTLEPAFPGDDPHLVMQDIAQKDPIPPRRLNPALPVDLETILLKAMSKDPSGRYATAQEMADDLGRYVKDQPIHARRPSIAARLSKWMRRHRGFVAAVFVVMLLGMAGLVADKFRVGAEQRKTRDALDQAHGNLRLARESIDKFLVEIGVSNMAEQPVPLPARQRLLEDALRFYERNFDTPATVGSRVTILHALHRYDDAIALLDRLLRQFPSDGWAYYQRGHMLWDLERHDDALAALDRSIQVRDSPEAHSFRGCVLKDLGRLDEALAELDRALALDAAISQRTRSLDSAAATFHVYRGEVLAALGRPQEALAAYDRSIELDGNLSNSHCGRGDVLAGLGQSVAALAAYDRAIAINAEDRGAHTGRGFLLRTLGRHEEALQAFERAVRSGPNAEGYTNLGIALKNLGRIDEAMAQYREAIRRNPALPQAHENLSIALLETGQLDAALAEIREAAALQPSNARIRMNLGSVHSARKEWDDAIREFHEAIRLQSDFADAYGNLGTTLANSGDLDAAIVNFLRAIELDRNNAEAWGGLGNARRDQGDFAGALDAYYEVVRIKPDYAVGRYCVGAELARMGRHREAEAAFLEAARLDPKFADAWHAKGNSLLSLGDSDGALEAYAEALHLQPEFPEAHYMRGKAYSVKRDLEREIAAYDDAIRQRPEYAEAYSNRGRALNDRGDFDGAIVSCNKALEIDPELPEAHLNLGIAYSGKDDHDGAIVHYGKAIEILSPRVQADPAKRSPRQAHDARNLALVYNSLACALGNKGEHQQAIDAFRVGLKIDNEVAPLHHNLANELCGASSDLEAEAEYREAFRIESDMAEAYCGLGRLFMVKGRYREALPLLRQGQEIGSSQVGSKRARWTPRPAEWIATIEHRLSLEDRLDRVVSGAESPRDAREGVEFATILYMKARYRDSAQIWEKSLAQDATIADELAASHRFNAACSAVLAAAAGGPEAATWRKQALRWLRADLAAREKAGLAATLDHWKNDLDFKSVREDAATLPAGERDGWKKLWADVDATMARSRQDSQDSQK